MCCVPLAQCYIHLGLGIFLTYSTSDLHLSTLYLDDFKTERTAKHMAYFMIRVFNTIPCLTTWILRYVLFLGAADASYFLFNIFNQHKASEMVTY